MQTCRPALAAPVFALLAPVLGAQEPAERLLAELDLEQRAAQLIMSFSYASLADDYARRDELRQWIEEAEIGGVILSLGDAATAVELVEDLQRRSRVPLLVAGDFEEGPAFRLEDTSDLGSAMLVGATRSSRFAYEMGRATAEEARAMGFHWNFAPVLDVNVNPANPIILVRSFGEDPALVSRLGAAFVRGSQAAGVLATGKHFPGHGDVSVDSHESLPTVAAARERLDAVEFAPFRAAVAAGLGSVMTGHLSVPALDDPSVPATMSAPILTGILRDEMGFGGMIVTDALEMGAIGDVVESRAEAAVRALAAGADVLLMPPDPMATRKAIVEAVESGRVPRERLDEACLRVLRAKADAGLLDGVGMPSARWNEIVLSAPHVELAEEIAARGVTIVTDPLGLVPIRASRVVVVNAFAGERDGRGDALVEALRGGVDALAVHEVTAGGPRDRRDAAIAAIKAVAEDEDAVVVCGIFPRAGRTAPRIDDVFEAVAAAPRAVVAILGNPYATDAIGENTTYVCGYHDSHTVEQAVARLLAGEGPALGRLPVTLPDVADANAGLTWLPPSQDLPESEPEEQGFAADLERRLRERLEQAVADRVFPGAVAVVARRGELVAEVAVGHETYDDGAAEVRVDSLFDLASLTKVCATTPAVLRLADRGELSLDARVSELVPSFSGGDKDRVTVRHLLTHSGGLAPFKRFWTEVQGRQQVMDAAAAAPLDDVPGQKFRYSDIGLMLLMACVESVTGEPFEDVVQREVLDPLGMESARFTTTGDPIDAIPTEVVDGRTVRGEVHDENARAMGGVSGHAGLFADARDVALLGTAFLGGGRGWLSPELARDAVRPQNIVAGSSRALGWDTFREGGSGGSLLSAGSFGHTGFTGTSMWCDPERDLVIVLLSNRVHPTRDNQKHSAVRAELADLVVRALRE